MAAMGGVVAFRHEVGDVFFSSAEIRRDDVIKPAEIVRESFPETWLWTERIMGYLSNLPHVSLTLPRSELRWLCSCTDRRILPSRITIFLHKALDHSCVDQKIDSMDDLSRLWITIWWIFKM